MWIWWTTYNVQSNRNMGYQDGCYVKAVEYNGEERIVTNERGAD